MILIHETCLQNIGDTVQKAAYGINALIRLLHNDQAARDIGDGDGKECLSGYLIGGLCSAIELLSQKLSRAGETLADIPETNKKAGV